MVFLSYLPGPRTDSEGVLFSIRHRSCTLAGMLHLGEIRADRSHSGPDRLETRLCLAHLVGPALHISVYRKPE